MVPAMFFEMSKIAGWLLSPANALWVAVTVSAVLLLTPWRRLGTVLAVSTAVLCFIIAATPVPEWSVRTLEDRFSPPARLPEHVDGIIILGGAIAPTLSDARGQVALNAHAERMTAGAALARLYPEAQVIFTGGDASLTRTGLTEAQFAETVLAELGVPPWRLTLERGARNTYENAAFSKLLARPQSEDVWLLVTSAAHMPRAMGCFQRVGFPVTPYPVDYRSDGRLAVWPPAIDFGGGLQNLTLAMHEWLGLFAYFYNDYTRVMFP